MTETPEKKPTCFVVMPISTPPNMAQMYGSDRHFEELLEHVFEPAIKDAGFQPISPSAKGSEVIEARIVKHLRDADLVLCDISSLNANVFFELGMRTAMGRPVAVVRDSHQKRIPFDTGSLNHKEYNPSLRAPNLKPLRERITAHILDCVDSEAGHNALLKWFGVRSAAADFKPADPQEALLKRMSLMLERVEHSGFLEYLENGESKTGGPKDRFSIHRRLATIAPEPSMDQQELLPRLTSGSEGGTVLFSNQSSNVGSSTLGDAGRTRARQSDIHSGTGPGSAGSQFGTLISRNRNTPPLDQCSTIEASSHSESDSLTIVSVHLHIDPISKKHSPPEGGLPALRDAIEASLEDLARRASIGLIGVESRLVVVKNELADGGGLESLKYHVLFEVAS